MIGPEVIRRHLWEARKALTQVSARCVRRFACARMVIPATVGVQDPIMFDEGSGGIAIATQTGVTAFANEAAVAIGGGSTGSPEPSGCTDTVADSFPRSCRS